ncbi:unnamed protein product, partial [Closterium sp. NIES-65]
MWRARGPSGARAADQVACACGPRGAARPRTGPKGAPARTKGRARANQGAHVRGPSGAQRGPRSAHEARGPSGARGADQVAPARTKWRARADKGRARADQVARVPVRTKWRARADQADQGARADQVARAARTKWRARADQVARSADQVARARGPRGARLRGPRGACTDQGARTRADKVARARESRGACADQGARARTKQRAQRARTKWSKRSQTKWRVRGPSSFTHLPPSSPIAYHSPQNQISTHPKRALTPDAHPPLLSHSPQTLRRFEFGVEVRLAPSLCEGTKLVIISPRFMVLADKVRQPFHWDDEKLGTYLVARLLSSEQEEDDVDDGAEEGPEEGEEEDGVSFSSDGEHSEGEEEGERGEGVGEKHAVDEVRGMQRLRRDSEDSVVSCESMEGREQVQAGASSIRSGGSDDKKMGLLKGQEGTGASVRLQDSGSDGQQQQQPHSGDRGSRSKQVENDSSRKGDGSSGKGEGSSRRLGGSSKSSEKSVSRTENGAGSEGGRTSQKKSAGKGRRSKGGEMDVDWDWSGAFDIDKPGESAVRIRHRRKRGKYAILSIDVSLNGASALVTFGICGSKHKPPPYRIENRSAFMSIKYGQLTTPTRQRLPPNHSTNYAWDQPRMAQLLQVEIEGFGVTREYDLDGIRELPTIILSEDDFTGNASLRDRMFVMVGTHARAVAALYVNVYADGATRVLSFSDTKHTSKVSEEDERTTLQEKLQVTSERIAFARKVLQRARALAGDTPLDALEAKASYMETPEYSAAMASFTPNHHPSVPSIGSSTSSARSTRRFRRSSSDTPLASTRSNPSASVVTATSAGSVKERLFSRADSEGSSPRTPPKTFRVFTGSSSVHSPASHAAGDPNPVTTPPRSPPLLRSSALPSSAAIATAKEARASGCGNDRAVSDCFDGYADQVKSQPGKAEHHRSISHGTGVLQAGKGGLSAKLKGERKAEKGKGVAEDDSEGEPSKVVESGDKGERRGEETHAGTSSHSQTGTRGFGPSRPELAKPGAGRNADAGEYAGRAARLEGQGALDYLHLPASAAAVPEYPMRLVEVTAYGVQAGAQTVKKGMEVVEGVGEVAEETLKGNGPYVGAVKVLDAEVPAGKIVEAVRHVESAAAEVKGMLKSAAKALSKEKLDGAEAVAVEEGAHQGEVAKMADTAAAADAAARSDVSTAAGKSPGVSGSAATAGGLADSGGGPWQRVKQRLAFMSQGKEKRKAQPPELKQEVSNGEDMKGGYDGREDRSERLVQGTSGEEIHRVLDTNEAFEKARVLSRVREGSEEGSEGEEEEGELCSRRDAENEQGVGMGAGATGSDAGRSSGDRARGAEKESSGVVDVEGGGETGATPREDRQGPGAAEEQGQGEAAESRKGETEGDGGGGGGEVGGGSERVDVPVSASLLGSSLAAARFVLGLKRGKARRAAAVSEGERGSEIACVDAEAQSHPAADSTSGAGSAVAGSVAAGSGASAAVAKSKDADASSSGSLAPPNSDNGHTRKYAGGVEADADVTDTHVDAHPSAAAAAPSGLTAGAATGNSRQTQSGLKSSSSIKVSFKSAAARIMKSAAAKPNRPKFSEVVSGVMAGSGFTADAVAALVPTPGTAVADDPLLPETTVAAKLNSQPFPEPGVRPTRGRVSWKGVVDKVSVGTTAAVVNTGKRVTGAASALHSAATAFLDGTSEKVQEKFHEAQEAFEEAEERAGEWGADEGFKVQVGAMRTVRSMESFFGRQADKLVTASRVPDMVKYATTAELRARWPHDSFRLPTSRSEGGESVGDGVDSELMPVPMFDELQNMAGAAAAAEREFIGKNRPSGLVKSASVAAGQMAAVARLGQDVVVKAGSVVKGAVGSALAAGSETAVAEGKALRAGAAVALNVMGGRLGDIKEHAEQDLQVSLADWRRRMQEAGLGAEEEEDISELRQERIHLGNEEYDAGAIVGGDVTIHVIKAMDLGLRPEKTHPYAVVQVEGRRLRSSVCKGTVCPQWDELLVFKGVSTASSMAVSIFSSETIGSHKFLGQVSCGVELLPLLALVLLTTPVELFAVVLPLVDGRALNREPGWHKLSRRTAHETVTGRVFLSTSWDATELELMALQVAASQGGGAGRTGGAESTPPSVIHSLLPLLPFAYSCAHSPLQLRAKEAELDALEERLAQEREARPREAVMAAEALANPHALLPHTPSAALRTPTGGGPMLRRMFTLRGHGPGMGVGASSVSPGAVQQHAAKGQLKVKVVEARHLAVPAEWLRSVHRMHAFAALSVVSPAGTSTLPVKTRIIKGSFFPKWNETFNINDVALTSSLRVQVFDKPKLGSPNLLGEATVDVTTFKDGLPQYMLLTLKRSAGREGVRKLPALLLLPYLSPASPVNLLFPIHPLRPSPLTPYSFFSSLPQSLTIFTKACTLFRLHAAHSFCQLQEQEAVGGSIRLRVHWMVDHGKKAEEKTGVNFMLNLHGMTVSVVDRLPREIMLVLLEDICCSWEESVKEVAGKAEVGKLQVENQLLIPTTPCHAPFPIPICPTSPLPSWHTIDGEQVKEVAGKMEVGKLQVKEVAGKVEVGKLQVDNQLLTARNPVVLSRTQAFPAEALFLEQGKELANQASLAGMLSTDPKEKEKAFVSVEFTRLLQHPSIVYYRRFLFQLQEFDLVLEEDFVDTAVAYLQQLPMEDLWQDKDKRGGEEEEEKKGDEDLVEDMAGAPITRTYLTRDTTVVSPMSRRHLVKSEPLEPLVNSSSWVAGNQGLRWYFERFQVQSMRINVTLVMNPIKSDAPPPSGSSSEWHLRTTASSAGFPLISLTRAPLRLNSLVLDNAFQNQSTLQTYVLRHYGVQLLQGLHKILGSVELLGAPLSLVDNLATGVMDFFVEPASATTPEEFLSGAVKGTVSLMKHSSYGVLHSISSLAGGIGSGFAKLTFDDSYIQRFSQRPEGTSQQVLRGAQDVGLGFVGAVTGLVLQPLEGARREGAVGAVKGVGKGVVGLVTKPLSGLLGFASTLTESAGTGIRAIGGDVSRRTVPRIRLPSTFGRNDAIALEPEDSVELKLLEPEDSVELKLVLAILDFGRYRDEHLLDHLQTSGRKAVLFTVARLIFYDCQRNVFYWQIPLKDITSVMGMEGRLESIILYDADVVIASKKLPLRVPARKVIKTTTRELHMALLVKLNRHLARIRTELPSSSSPSTPRHASREPVAAGAADSGSLSPSRGPSASSSPAPSPSTSLPSPLRLAQSPGNVSELSAGGGKAAGRPGKAADAGVDNGASSGGGETSGGRAGRAHNRKQSSLSKALTLQREKQEEDEKAEKEEEGASEAAYVLSVSGGATAATAATRWKKQANTRDGAGGAADKGKSPAELTHSRSAPARARKSSFRRGKGGGGGRGYDMGKHAVIHEDVDVDAAHVDQDDSDEDDYSEDANGVVARVAQLDREERQEVRRNLDAILTTCQVAIASAGGRSDPASALVSVKFLALAAYSRVQSHRAHQATLGARALQGVQRGDSQWEEDVSALLRTMVALSEGGETGSLRDQSQILGTLEAICHQAIGR